MAKIIGPAFFPICGFEGTTKKRIFVLFILLMSLIVVSCGGPKIDGSSQEKFDKSLKKMNEKLTEDEKDKLTEAMIAIAFENLDFEDLLFADTEDYSDEIKEKLDGKTAKQIISEGDRIKREKALAEISELKEKEKEVKESQVYLKKIEISKAKFYKRKEMFGVQPIIEFSAKNGLDEAISKIYCRGTISSPERSVPWFVDEFNYNISGGLEPGESANWSLAPNIFSDWADAKNPKGSIFTIEVLQVDGANGEILYTTLEFSLEDKERLSELLEEYPDATD